MIYPLTFSCVHSKVFESWVTLLMSLITSIMINVGQHRRIKTS